MSLPDRPARTDENLKLPDITSLLPSKSPNVPKRAIRKSQESPNFTLPRIGGAQTGQESKNYPFLLRQTPYNSEYGSDFGIPRIPGNRCKTAGTPTRINGATSLYERLSQLNLTNSMDKCNLVNNPNIPWKGRPSTSNNIDILTADYYQLKQNNFSKSPYLPTLRVMDPKKLQALKNSINTTTTRIKTSGNTISSNNQIQFGIQSKNQSAAPQLLSKPKKVNQIKKTESVLSNYTVLDPASQYEIDFFALKKMNDKLHQIPDLNNNLDLLRSPSSVDSTKLASKTIKRRQANVSNLQNSNDFCSLSSSTSQTYVHPLVGKRGKKIADPAVKNLSSKMYGKLEGLGLEKGFFGNNPVEGKKETLIRLKKAYAVLQQELKDLNVDEKDIFSKGMDFNLFEQEQKRELQTLRNSVHPHRESLKRMAASDFRGELSVPLSCLHDVFKRPEIDKSLLPQKISRQPKKVPFKNIVQKLTSSGNSPDKRVPASSQLPVSRHSSTDSPQKRLMVKELISSEGYRNLLQQRGVVLEDASEMSKISDKLRSSIRK